MTLHIDQPPSSEPVVNVEVPKKRTRSATKTRMAGHVGPGLHYKHVRTTIVLLRASTVFREFTLKEQAAFTEIAEHNYDLSSATNLALEHAFAKLDDEVMKRVRDEFEFVPGLASIRNHGACIAACALCGKGDSKDDGSNRDKLQYDFRLQNLHGGEELWVGSNCIVNFGLKVRGAETSEEARQILERTLREHITMWRKEQWRAEHIDHADIPEHAKQMYRFAQQYHCFYGRYRDRRSEISALGQDAGDLWRKTSKSARAMRGVGRFYERADYLTPVKEKAWREARGLIQSLRWLTNALEVVSNLPYEQRRERCIAMRREREAHLAKIRQSRQPRQIA